MTCAFMFMSKTACFHFQGKISVDTHVFFMEKNGGKQ